MRLIILGAGGHGKVVTDLAEQTGRYNEVCFLDDNFKDEQVIGKCGDLKKSKVRIHLCILTLVIVKDELTGRIRFLKQE